MIREKALTFGLITIILGLSLSANTTYGTTESQNKTLNILNISSKTLNLTNGEYWYRLWDGGEWSVGHDVAVDSSNNIYITGGSNSDMVLIKYNTSGDQQWNRTWGGSGWDTGYGLVLDSFGNIYITGETGSYGAGNGDVVLVKYNASGEFEWYRTWGGIYMENGKDVAVDSFGNIYITGMTRSYGPGGIDVVLVKYNTSGEFEWYRTWGGSEYDIGNGLVLDSFGNIYITGTTNAGDDDVIFDKVILVKYNASGEFEWHRTWAGNAWNDGNDVAVDSSNNIYITGKTSGAGADDVDIILVKYNTSGDQQWNRTWGGNGADSGNGLVIDSSGKIYITGNYGMYGPGGSDVALVKYNNTGGFEGSLIWGGSNDDWFEGIAVDSEGNIFLAGQTWSFGATDWALCIVKNPIDMTPPPPLYPPQLIPLIILVFLLSLLVIYIIKPIAKQKKGLQR